MICIINLSFYLIVILLTIINHTIIIKSQSTDFQSVITDFENEAKRKAIAIENSIETRCQTALCVKSYKSCISNMPNKTCLKDFGTAHCNKCFEDKGQVLSSSSNVRLANVYFPPTDETDPVVNEVVCATRQSENEFKEVRSAATNLWTFFGSYNGIMRTYPGSEACNKYDPRTRPWYVGAATGAKNVILVIDTSGSMDNSGRMNIAKSAAKSVIITLNNFDWFSIVEFNSKATTFKPTLLRGNSANQDEALKYIDSLVPSGSTNFEEAFNSVYQIIENSIKVEKESSCERVILFLTDGQITEGKEDQAIIDHILQLDSPYNAMILTYSLGAEADKVITKKIACAKRGIFEDIENILDLQKAMNSYYLLLSSGLTRSEVVWSEPYVDLFGLGEVVSATVPVYDRSFDPPFLVGVYGQDMAMSEITKFGENSDVILNAFITRSQQCSKFNLSDCQMNSIRKNKCDDIIDNCTPLATELQQCTNISPRVAFDENQVISSNSLEDLEPQCCGETDKCATNIGAIVGGVVGGILVIILIIVIVICIKKKKVDQINNNINQQNNGYNNPNNYNSNNNNNNNNNNNPNYDPSQPHPNAH